MMGTVPRETVTKQCNNCSDLFKADIDGTGRCLEQFCSVRCEEQFHTECRRQSQDYELVNETFCSECAKTKETQWNGKTRHAQGRKMSSNFLSHIRHIHCEDGQYPIDLTDEERPTLYLYKNDEEVWKQYDKDEKYWHTIPEEDVPAEVLEEREE